ncbi:MAG: DUF6011 domain-containing protein [Clostridiaceae bacterium]|nr:DUF6011 domain-containing protein [Clostridiaceae bacterium]
MKREILFKGWCLRNEKWIEVTVMTCSVCGRELKSAKSKELGYGPICYRKVFGSVKKFHFPSSEPDVADIQYYEVPGQMRIEDFLRTDAE